MGEKNSSKEINLTRVYDAPVKTVWDAYTDPAQAAQWWGPRGFTITSHSKDLRPGGTWDYTMHGPDGKDYPNLTKYLEVKEHSRLVYDHGGTKDSPPMFRVTVDFVDLKGKTRMDMCMGLPTPEAAAKTREYIKKAGGNAAWDRFAEYLEKGNSGKEVFVINRSFEAPVEMVFDMWTKPEHFSRWLAPTGFTMNFLEANIREGGSTFYSMTDGKAVTMYGRAKYSKISRPEKLVYTQQFCDKDGKISRHPFAPTWPETMQTTVLFTEEGPSQTRVTVHWEVVGKATSEELETFIKGRAGMTQGWTGSFDKLEEHLAK
ncbi:MAG: hypothetical protein A2901_01935 [Elusimicrobia bacterium RIFCSPLOWO2_01_FULL_54_10]|nr:MAG: hypothetical protein A2901_01935 [Elusimicrobia bacterium RIFCSPLOWO2_01_FULL_54_10]